MTVKISCDDEGETRAVGQRLASMLRAGDVVLLAGDLGTGKTLFTGGIADGLGVEGPVTSPSFVLVRRYDDGFLPLVHADVYRLGSRAEFHDLDLLEEAHDGVLVVEWGQAVEDLVPSDYLSVVFTVSGPTRRTLEFRPHGCWERRPLEELSR